MKDNHYEIENLKFRPAGEVIFLSINGQKAVIPFKELLRMFVLASEVYLEEEATQ